MRIFGLFAAGAFVASLGQSALAGSYDDFSRGLEARNRGDVDAEIAAFSRALADGDLLASLKPVALYDRGVAYLQQKNYAEAIADLSSVIKQKSDDYEAHQARAATYQASGDFEAALPDCAALTLLRPQSAFVLGWCGRIAFQAGRYDQASDYFQHALQSSDKDPKAPYDLLWLGLAALRAGKAAASEMNGPVRFIDGNGWPAPLIQFFLARVPEGAVRAAAAAGDATSRRNQECEVGFYLGEWKLAYQDRSEAKSLLQQAASLCPDDYIELDPAKTELKKLEQGLLR